MSILIKGMKMPKDCRECPLEMYYMNCGETRCRATRRTLATDFESIPFDGRAYDCPLTELPQRHGRLIDADAFTKYECNYCDGACEALPCDCLNCKSDCRCDFMKDIANAPTILEAEPPSGCEDCKYWDGERCANSNRKDCHNSILWWPKDSEADYPPSVPLEQVWTELFGEDGEA